MIYIWRQYLAVLLCTISVAATAISFTWLEPLVDRLVEPDSEFNVTTSETSWLVSFIEVGEIVSTIPAGLLADWFGRKWVLYSIGPLCLFSWALVLTTRSVLVLYVVRFVQGLALGTVFALAPMYIAEVAEPKLRGRLSGQFQTMWAFGILFTYVTGPYLSYDSYAYVCAILPIIFTIFFPFMPESPFYLLMKGSEEKARESLIWLRGTPDIGTEFQRIKQSIEKDMKMKGSWKDLIATRNDRKILFIVQTVCFVKYMIGSPAINSYAASMFAQASGGALNEHMMTIWLGIILMLSAFCGAFMSDAIGRRPLLIGSTFLCTILHTVSAVYFYLANHTDIDVSGFTWVMYSAVGGSCFVTYLGLAPLLQTLQAELFPSHTRAIGSGMTGITASIATFVDLKQYQTVVDMFGLYMNFVIFAAFGLFGTVIMYYVIPETKGKGLGEATTVKKKSIPNDVEMNSKQLEAETQHI